MKGIKQEHGFIKDIGTPFGNIETLKTLMHVTIPKEYTTCGPKLKLMGDVRV
jgi:hypothetical protein